MPKKLSIGALSQQFALRLIDWVLPLDVWFWKLAKSVTEDQHAFGLDDKSALAGTTKNKWL